MNKPNYFLLQVIRKILNGIIHAEAPEYEETSEVACRIIARQLRDILAQNEIQLRDILAQNEIQLRDILAQNEIHEN